MEKVKTLVKWGKIVLPYLALIALGLSASYGVFQFSLLYVPVAMAYVTAAAFELTYIGLAVVPLSDKESKGKAVWVAQAAVLVSVAYNVISGFMHRNPTIPTTYGGWIVEMALSMIHGLPLASVGYYLSTLILHTTQAESSESKETVTLQESPSENDDTVKVDAIETKEPIALLADSESKEESKPTEESDKKTRIVELKAQGKNNSEIGKLVNLSRQRVGQLLKEVA